MSQIWIFCLKSNPTSFKNEFSTQLEQLSQTSYSVEEMIEQYVFYWASYIYMIEKMIDQYMFYWASNIYNLS